MHYPSPCQHGPDDVWEGVSFPYRLVARVQPAGAAEAGEASHGPFLTNGLFGSAWTLGGQ
jgi:hypothetical protein